jgi:hypothetical protein
MPHGDPRSTIGPAHPLRMLFEQLCRWALIERVGLGEPRVAAYLGDLLTRFTHRDQLYRIRDAAGKPLDDVGEMLLESDPRSRAPSFEREREVRRHLGDTLFFLGLFPEYLGRHATTRVGDLFVEWARVGRDSYRTVAAFDIGPHAAEAPLFARLAEHFDFCALGLNLVKQELDRMADPNLRALRDAFGEG